METESLTPAPDRFSIRPAWDEPLFWIRALIPLLAIGVPLSGILIFLGESWGFPLLAKPLIITLSGVLCYILARQFWQRQPARLVRRPDELRLENMLGRLMARLPDPEPRTLTLYWLAQPKDNLLVRLIHEDPTLAWTRWILQGSSETRLTWEMPGTRAHALLAWLGYTTPAEDLAQSITDSPASLLELKIDRHSSDEIARATYRILTPLQPER